MTNTRVVVWRIVSCFLCILLVFYLFVIQIEWYGDCDLNTNLEQLPRVLFVGTFRDDGGAVTCLTHQYKALRNKKAPVLFLTSNRSILVKKLQSMQLPVVACNDFRLSFKNTMWQPGLEEAMTTLVRRYGVSIIHVNSAKEAVAAGKVARKNPSVRVVYSQHMADPLPVKILAVCDAVIGVSDHVCSVIKANCGVSLEVSNKFFTLPPFFDSKPFFNFTTHETREQFFKRAFAIDINSGPLLCMIAHFYRHIACKNHPLLFEAIRILRQEKNIPVQLVLAGDGESSAYCKKMVAVMGLSDAVYFLGATKQAPALLFYADMSLLTSGNEAFGIVLLESGCMKKPVVVSSAVGAVGSLIRDGQTGFVFPSGNARVCAETIAQVLEDKKKAQIVANQLFNEVTLHYTEQFLVARLIAIYEQIIKNSSIKYE